jgi:hypothetical protein
MRDALLAPRYRHSTLRRPLLPEGAVDNSPGQPEQSEGTALGEQPNQTLEAPWGRPRLRIFFLLLTPTDAVILSGAYFSGVESPP